MFASFDRSRRLYHTLAVATVLLGARSAGAQAPPPTTFTLDVGGFGLGRGTVKSVPAGIDCTLFDTGGATGRSGSCSVAFNSGTQVTLTATPDAGVTFTGWESVCTGAGACVVAMSQARFVTARFTPSTFYTLTVQMIGNGYGNVREELTRGQPPLNCAISGGSTSGVCTTQVGATMTTRLLVNPSGNFPNSFLGFGGACSGNGICTLFMNGPKTVTVNIRTPAVELRSGDGTGTGTVTGPSGICTITPSGVSGICLWNITTSSVPLFTATATGNSVFTGWGGGCSGVNTCAVPAPGIAAPTVVTARFDLPSFGLTVSGAGTGSGSVQSAPSGIACASAAGVLTGVCTASFNVGAVVTLTPTASAGSQFAGWSGSCTGSGPCQVTMAAARAVTARFERTSATVSVTGSGSGTVTSTPGTLACTLGGAAPAGTCSAPFALGAAITLKAVPASGWLFGGWGGACTGTTDCSLIMSADRGVTVTFSRQPVTLTIIANGSGIGSVQSDPAGIGCTISGTGTSGACASQFAFGSQVQLTAAGTGGSTFVGWSAPCGSGTGSCNLTLSAGTTITATFNGNLVALSVLGAGNGDGIVRSSVGGMTCRIEKGAKVDPGCGAGVLAGTPVTLTADPQNGSTFAGWTGLGCAGSALTCQVTIAAASNVTARFNAPLPAAQLVEALFGVATLAPDQQVQLDRFGNNNGRFDLGDVLAHLDRSGEVVSPAMVHRLRAAAANPSSRRVP